MKWRKIEKVLESTHQLIGDDGRILGEVESVRHAQERGFIARIETPDVVRLGRFVTEKKAKEAVERAINERDSD